MKADSLGRVVRPNVTSIAHSLTWPERFFFFCIWMVSPPKHKRKKAIWFLTQTQKRSGHTRL